MFIGIFSCFFFFVFFRNEKLRARLVIFDFIVLFISKKHYFIFVISSLLLLLLLNILEAIKNLPENQGKSYYYNGYYRLEMTPIGFEHARDHHVVFLGVSLYAILKEIPFQGLPTCSYRKKGIREVQPDISYYLGEKANLIPNGTSIIDLNQYPPPDLVIEISKSTLNDDLGNKRLLYEELGVSEYWSVQVDDPQIFPRIT